MKTIKIAFDVMGGDIGLKATLPAALDRLERYPHLHLVLVGDEEAIRSHLRDHHAVEAQKLAERWSIHHAPDKVNMDELPSQALRKKRNSSMRLALDLIKADEAQACVSAGNTGALMAMARFVLKTLPGIDRPAIAGILPTLKGHCLMLDLGANVDCLAEHLVQFAVMGSVLASTNHGIENPRVALLNIGVEQIKGNLQVKTADQHLQGVSSINYTGYIEGDGIYAGDADVVVSDGFVGNVALKTSEGIAKMLMTQLKRKLTSSWITQILALALKPKLKSLADDLDPRRYNGASLVGLRGIVVKSHGGADAFALACAIDECVREVEHNVPKRIEEKITHLMEEMSL